MTLTVDLGAAARGLVVAVFGVLALIIIWLLIARVRGFFASLKFGRTDRATLRRRWQEIEVMLQSPGEMGRKMAVMEADKLLDQALKVLAMPGATLGERLKFAEYKYPQLRQVWWAHRVRNQLVHEASYHLDRGLALKATRAYRAALQQLGAI